MRVITDINKIGENDFVAVKDGKKENLEHIKIFRIIIRSMYFPRIGLISQEKESYIRI